ncbi:OLC1v1013110C1 [Oldenlandia corymbosa var. corymbosa]|uniref:OLC1v1013110C1 n=1 Tax=Oldenlandia corymbosa var. corymbosa TaxID=529605 RepID=A0AAV1DY73_OLDCO|nr:OLC1v1013110C1 [Oldenlandia corymbosa var. corymbosa]
MKPNWKQADPDPSEVNDRVEEPQNIVEEEQKLDDSTGKEKMKDENAMTTKQSENSQVLRKQIAQKEKMKKESNQGIREIESSNRTRGVGGIVMVLRKQNANNFTGKKGGEAEEPMDPGPDLS